MAYTKTLKQYHNWVVRGIFSLALRSVPGKENFLACLSVDPNDFYNNPEGFEKQVITFCFLFSFLNIFEYKNNF